MSTAIKTNPLARKFIRKFRIAKERMRGLDLTTYWEGSGGTDDPEEDLFYAAIEPKDLYKVLDSLNITNEHTIIDIGSGKGAALYYMMEYPFKAIHGVELGEEMHHIAVRNFKKLGDPRVQVFLQDAKLFTDYDMYTHLYFYHPFPPSIMQPVLDNILASLERAPRDLVIIYGNPAPANNVLFEKAGFYIDKKFEDNIVHDILIFKKA